MPARFVNIDHDTPLLLPLDLRQWVAPDHLVHFLMDAVGELDLSGVGVNERGTGDAQYPPRLLLGLLIYSYATGVFASRQIEAATYDRVAVRLLCADTHPDHDTICTFRRENRALLAHSFARVIELSARCGVLKVGAITVAIDGTKVLASASKHAGRQPCPRRRTPAGVGRGNRSAAAQSRGRRQRAARRRPLDPRRGAAPPGAQDATGPGAGRNRSPRTSPRRAGAGGIRAQSGRPRRHASRRQKTARQGTAAAERRAGAEGPKSTSPTRKAASCR